MLLFRLMNTFVRQNYLLNIHPGVYYVPLEGLHVRIEKEVCLSKHIFQVLHLFSFYVMYCNTAFTLPRYTLEPFFDIGGLEQNAKQSWSENSPERFFRQCEQQPSHKYITIIIKLQPTKVLINN